MKKKLLTACVLVVCALALVAGSVLTTIALLTSSANVTNTFTIGEVKITMDETKVNPNGTAVEGAARVDANSYHLVPNTTYIKDPTIHIGSGEMNDMYLFVKSTNMIRSAEAGNVNEGNDTSMREQMIANGWVEYVRSGDGVEIVWVYGTRNTVTGEITPTPVNSKTEQLKKDGTKVGIPAGDFRLCENFTIDEHANVSLYGAATVTFTAFAIQDDGFTETDHALTVKTWESIKSSFPYHTGILEPKNPYSNESNVDAYAPVAGVPDPVEIPIDSSANP
ncbi:MAG: hypothetical protein E7468_04630 [Ruminococcaceae bacterium]|nr:hypothetical protein [Oscillospiraceae bacterium]